MQIYSFVQKRIITMKKNELIQIIISFNSCEEIISWYEKQPSQIALIVKSSKHIAVNKCQISFNTIKRILVINSIIIFYKNTI